MALLLADEDFPLPAVRTLRGLGHDVLTAAEAGMANRRIPDPIVLEYASRLGRAVVTFNRADFVELHDAGDAHAGIIVCETDADFSALAARIHEAIGQESSLAGRLVEVRKGPA